MVKHSFRISKEKEKEKTELSLLPYRIDQEGKEVEGIGIANKSESLHEPLNKELQKLEETENVKKKHEQMSVSHFILFYFFYFSP